MIKNVQERFRDEFLKKSAPNKKSIFHLVEKFSEQVTVWYLPHERTNTVLMPQTLAILDEKLTANLDLCQTQCHVVREEKLSYRTAHHRTIAFLLCS